MESTQPSSQSFWNGSPKTLFFMGLFLGLAVTSTIGLVGAVGYMASAKTGNTVAAVQPLPSAGTGDVVQPQAPANPVKPVDDKVDHIRGPKDAKVTVIEYSDFECPFCKRHDPTVTQLRKAFPKDVRVIYRHYPLSFHPAAEPAAIASECVAKISGNDKFWEYHDKLFASSPDLSNDTLKRLAKEIGVKEADFNKCLDNKETLAKVNADMASGNDSGVEGTPATFINGQMVSGAVPYATLEAAVKAAGATN